MTVGVRLVFAIAAVVLLPMPVLGQAASPVESGTQLEVQTRQRRVIVRPNTPPEAVQADAEAARIEVEQRQQHQRAQAVTRPAPRRPDLDYDVKSGIQSQRLNDALRR